MQLMINATPGVEGLQVQCHLVLSEHDLDRLLLERRLAAGSSPNSSWQQLAVLDGRRAHIDDPKPALRPDEALTRSGRVDHRFMLTFYEFVNQVQAHVAKLFRNVFPDAEPALAEDPPNSCLRDRTRRVCAP